MKIISCECGHESADKTVEGVLQEALVHIITEHPEELKNSYWDKILAKKIEEIKDL